MTKLTSFLLACTLFIGVLGTTFSVNAAGWGCSWGFSCGDPGAIQYCQGNSCGIQQGREIVVLIGGDLFTNRTTSQYVTDVVRYFLGFVTLFAAVYVLYAGFQLLTSAGDDEKLKKARQIIIYTLSGIVVMWLAYWIVILIITAIN